MKQLVGSKHTTLYSFLLFLVIFNPPVYPGFSFTVMACVLSFFYLLNNRTNFGQIIRNIAVRRFLKANFLVFVIYGVTVITSMGKKLFTDYLVDYLSYVVYFVLVFIVACSLVIYALKNNFDKETIIKCFVHSAIIECILVIASFLIPSIKSFFVSLMSMRVEDSHIESYNYTSDFRNFGLASSLYDIFGYAMSILALMAFYKAKTFPKYYLLFAIISFCGLINARTTIVLVFLGILAYYASSFGRFIKNIFIFISITIVLVLLIFPTIESMDNLARLMSGIDEMRTLIVSGEATGYFDILFNEFIVFPSTILGVLLGEGDIPLVVIAHGSDIGYIQTIWRYGIIGSIIVYSAHISFFRGSGQNNSKYSSLIRANIVMFLLYQVKLSSLGYSQTNVIIYTFILGLLVLPSSPQSFVPKRKRNRIKAT